MEIHCNQIKNFDDFKQYTSRKVQEFKQGVTERVDLFKTAIGEYENGVPETSKVNTVKLIKDCQDLKWITQVVCIISMAVIFFSGPVGFIVGGLSILISSDLFKMTKNIESFASVAYPLSKLDLTKDTIIIGPVRNRIKSRISTAGEGTNKGLANDSQFETKASDKDVGFEIETREQIKKPSKTN